MTAAEVIGDWLDRTDFGASLECDHVNCASAILAALRAAPAETRLALAREIAPDQWQPIETAPRDAMVVLCMTQHRGYLHTPMKVGYMGEDGTWVVFGGSWQPTHWQPLPAPPVAAAAPREGGE